MKNYLKHLKENPSKIVWLAFVWIFAIVLACILSISKDVIIGDNSELVYYLLWLFVVVVILVANYQPYKEYKDGL